MAPVAPAQKTEQSADETVLAGALEFANYF
jgi:hypothetical protein